MQVLRIKKRDGEGKEITVGVKVLTAWVDGSGRQVFLHSNGVYGYKDGSPIRSAEELEIIGSQVQREMASRWWEAVGKEMSNKFYSDREKTEREQHGDFLVDPLAVDHRDLDQAMYRRRKKGGKKNDWGPAMAWLDMFPRRPDWWGQADAISLPDYEYERVVLETADVTGDVSPEEI